MIRAGHHPDSLHKQSAFIEKEKTRQHAVSLPVTGSADIVKQRGHDTLLINKLNRLRALRIEPDLNEPLSRDYLFSRIESDSFPSLIELSPQRYFQLRFDNDLLDNTDRFYTNGVRLEYICPAFSGSPVNKLMLPYRRPGTNYYGLTLVQNMYTSSKTKVGGILYGDRPYAAYLYLSSFKITNDPVHHLRQSSELQLGIIGPASLGSTMQTWFHMTIPTNDKPLGWEYQIANDLLLNYRVSYDQGLISHPYAELNLTGVAIAGTVYDKITGGFCFRTGLLNPYFNELGFSKKPVHRRAGMRDLQCYFYARTSGTLVGYDATLQGGVFNHESVYTIPADSISRVQFEGSAGFAFSYGGARLDVEQHVISPEFRGGWWHFWMGIGLGFSF